MSVRKAIPQKEGLYFVTITCSQWLRLFDIVRGYDIVYNCFDHLKSKGHLICGYVIMPNHLHALIAFRNTGKPLNTIIGNGKRFMALDLLKRLNEQQEEAVLNKLASCVNEADRAKGQLHKVFEPSFDWKECFTEHFILQKLSYMHDNPCRGTWHRAHKIMNIVQQGFTCFTNKADMK